MIQIETDRDIQIRHKHHITTAEAIVLLRWLLIDELSHTTVYY
jgi:hypothetical protein